MKTPLDATPALFPGSLARRIWLRSALGLLLIPAAAGAAHSAFDPVLPGRELRFPDDEGSHPGFRIEWWYVTGWLESDRPPAGFQVTFFRTRPHPDNGNPSRFAPRSILIAHAALAEAAHGRLRHAQRGARAGFGLAEANPGGTDVRIDDWLLQARAGRYSARIAASDFAFDLLFEPTQPRMLQGDRGYSRKGPRAESASYYYSLPHLTVAGTIRVGSDQRAVQGSAWLDHEWSSQYLARAAVGWDWAGINFDDGSALMAFRMRGRDGSAYWAAATLRSAAGAVLALRFEEVAFTPLRTWRSPRTGAVYPVAMRVRAGDLTIDLTPLMDDQENDARITTGAVYWEGAVSSSQMGGRTAGRGYLELTGYVSPLAL